MEWQHHIADLIQEAERSLASGRGLPRGPHLISQNIANGKARIQDPHPAVSIFNFHYATPPDTVALNYGLNKAIGDNETGFKGTNDTHYRMEGWEFMLAGGALYNNLDYSFVAGHERGDFVYPASQPGGGTAALRRQLGVLKTFIDRFDFIRLQPDNSILKGGLPEKARVRALVEPGKQNALYLFGGTQANLVLELPAGTYQVEWLNPITAQIGKREKLQHAGGPAILASPAYAPDIALRVVR